MTSGRSAGDPNERLERIVRDLAVPPHLARDGLRTATLTERMEFYRVPGISFAVVDDYRLESAYVAGVLEVGGTAAVTIRTLFQAGSLAKPVVALAALRLVEAGAINLDADVNSLLTTWKVPPNGAWQPRVTLRHVLTHTSGFTVPLYPGYPREATIPTVLQVLDGERPARTPAVRVDLIPGTQYRYSSGAFVVLQQLLMDVTGLSFAELMRELVLGPLGMDDSTFEQPLPEHRRHRAATGHRNGGQPVQGGWFVYPEAAQGGLWTTPSDLARFVIELQKARAGHSGRLLSTEMANEMLSPHIDNHVGLGIFHEGDASHPRFSHLGGNEGFSSRLTAFREMGVGAVVMTNWHYRFLVDEVFAAIANEYDWPGYLPQQPRAVALDAAILERYVGEYQLRPDTSLRISRTGHVLLLETSGQLPIEFYAESETHFRARAVNAVLAFRSTAGRPIELIVEQADRQLSATRLE
jgi:CubicO group peptidase (beta-lactamase class C family)